MKSLISHGRTGLIGLGLGLLSTGVILVASLSDTLLVTVEQDLTHYWRTTYDILVRPAGSRSPIEEKYGLVEANHLSGIPGGISFAQYEAMRDIPGVEVAAPVAMLGYLAEEIPLHNVGFPSEMGLYELTSELAEDTGVGLPAFQVFRASYYYVNPSAGIGSIPEINVNVNPPLGIRDYIEFPFLMAGIEPAQEAALVGLDRALVEGKYLSGEEALPLETTTDWLGNPITQTRIPVLINATPYLSFTIKTELKRVVLPSEISGLDALAAQSSQDLASLPRETLAIQQSSSKAVYQKLLENLRFRSSQFTLLHESPIGVPAPMQYQETVPPFPWEGVALEIVLPEETPQTLWTVGSVWGRPYRAGSFVRVGDEKVKFRVAFSIYAKGVLDIEKIPRPVDVNRVPLETYFPPVSILRYDEEGHPVEARMLRPSLNWAGYIQPPPLLLTTLQAARLLRGDNCISAIRVRVGGID
ncbi:hypothetical protein, partial [Thermogutta sp.]|uniref:hypothetical protein n=1 Tax=Thermogutta sp. TaxID=1962930 RepID=UPI00321FF342